MLVSQRERHSPFKVFVGASMAFFVWISIYLTTVLLQAVAWLVQSCHVTSSFQNTTTQEKLKTKRKCKNEYTALPASNTALQELINIIKYSIWNGHRRIRHSIWVYLQQIGMNKKYHRKARISHKWCTRSRGCYQNLLQYLRKSSTAQNAATKKCDGSSSGRPNKNMRSNSTLLRQSKSSGDLLSVTILQDPIAKDRSCDIIKFTVKEEVNLSFDITANASTIRFFIHI